MTVSQAPEHIAARVASLRQEIPPQVRVIAVTKLLPADCIRAAYAAGIRDFGESRVQEAIEKQASLTDLPDITWHLIGHLQSNKVRKAVEHFHWIHSVDSLKIARRLDQAAADLQRQPRCCLQVKMVPDPPKFGFDLDGLEAALPALNDLNHLRINGIMTIPPQHTPPDQVQAIFSAAQHLATRINQQAWGHLHLGELSLGMSGDYRQGIAAGATMVRLGTTLFGPRPR